MRFIAMAVTLLLISMGSIQAAELPSRTDVEGIVSACGMGFSQGVQANISGRLKAWQRKVELDGKLSYEELAGVLAKTPENAQISPQLYSTYTKCILEFFKAFSNHNETNGKLEISPDPRKELANMGISFDADSFSRAVQFGPTSNVDLFLKGGMSPNSVVNYLDHWNNQGFALCGAIWNNHNDFQGLYSLFIEHGLDFHKTYGGKTQEYYAYRMSLIHNRDDIIELLAKSGADPSSLLSEHINDQEKCKKKWDDQKGKILSARQAGKTNKSSIDESDKIADEQLSNCLAREQEPINKLKMAKDILRRNK